jgi:hypothetical protein
MNTQHTSWNDFNDAEAQQGFDLIPQGTLVPVRMTIKPGGYDDPANGWNDGYATESMQTGAVYLACEFVVTSGPYAKRKMWSNVGLHSPKGPAWGQMGRSFIRAVLNSARNILPKDNSPQAVTARRIHGFAELDGIEFAARIDIEKGSKGEDRNAVKIAIEPDHKDYAALMGVNTQGGNLSAPVQAYIPSARTTAQPVTGKPAWAQ